MELGTLLALAGFASDLFTPDPDPNKKMREEMERILGQIEAEFPKMRSAIRSRAGIERGQLSRTLTDKGAAAGLPRNIILQNISRGFGDIHRGTEESLGRLGMQKMDILQNLANLWGQIPPEPQNTLGSDMFGLGLQMMLGGGGPDVDFSWLFGKKDKINPSLGLNLKNYKWD